jgi:hypothetical protein
MLFFAAMLSIATMVFIAAPLLPFSPLPSDTLYRRDALYRRSLKTVRFVFMEAFVLLHFIQEITQNPNGFELFSGDKSFAPLYPRILRVNRRFSPTRHGIFARGQH